VDFHGDVLAVRRLIPDEWVGVTFVDVGAAERQPQSAQGLGMMRFMDLKSWMVMDWTVGGWFAIPGAFAGR
jgi:hypothetical protein